MLDTDTVSYALRGVGGVVERLMQCTPAEVCISVLSVAELRFGAARKQSSRLQGLIDDFLTGVRPVGFDVAAAGMFGQIAADLSGAGTPIGPIDTLIAAHAATMDITLVSNNAQHFARVKVLRTENWRRF